MLVCFALHWSPLLCLSESSLVFQLNWGSAVFGEKGTVLLEPEGCWQKSLSLVPANEDSKTLQFGGLEDGGWIGGSWVHLLLPQPRFLADILTMNLNNQQHLSWYEVLKPMSIEDALYYPVRGFYKLKGKYPVHGSCRIRHQTEISALELPPLLEQEVLVPVRDPQP